MDMIGAEEGSERAELQRRLKEALDPNNVIAPGRYSSNKK
jgi:FAD/FMN-containing dehydrogenase